MRFLALALPSLVTALTFCLSPPAFAAEVASDHEIYAGYCIGVFAAHKETLPIPSLSTPGIDARIVEAYRKIHRDIDQHTARFATYLETRGLLDKNRRDEVAEGVLVAKRRGMSDWLACNEAIEVCARTCRSSSKVETCTLNCSAKDQRCRSAERCEGPDSLPF